MGVAVRPHHPARVQSQARQLLPQASPLAGQAVVLLRPLQLPQPSASVPPRCPPPPSRSAVILRSKAARTPNSGPLAPLELPLFSEAVQLNHWLVRHQVATSLPHDCLKGPLHCSLAGSATGISLSLLSILLMHIMLWTFAYVSSFDRRMGIARTTDWSCNPCLSEAHLTLCSVHWKWLSGSFHSVSHLTTLVLFSYQAQQTR